MKNSNYDLATARAALESGPLGGDTAASPEALQSLLWSISHRRSMGLARLKSDPVDPEVIELLLEAANWAPSHGETEPWRFTVFTGAGRAVLGDAFADAYRHDTESNGADFRQENADAHRNRAFAAPVWISLGVQPAQKPDGSLVMGAEEEVLAVTCAIQNLHLTASALGLAGMWHSKGTSVHPRVARALGLEAPGRLLGFFFCGWPKADWPAGERRPLESKVRWVTDNETQTPTVNNTEY